jgi:hypothetical protein
MPKRRNFQPFVKSLITENVLQLLEFSDYELDGLLLPNKKNEPNIIKSFESFTEKKKKTKKGDPKPVVPKTVIPIKFSEDFIYAIEGIFVELKTFISEHYSTISKNKTIISNLIAVDGEENIISTLYALDNIFDDEYNLLSYKQHDILEYLSTNILHKVTHPEISHLFTRFILTLCNYIVANIIIKRKAYKISALELKTIIHDKSNNASCKALLRLNDIIDEFITNEFIKKSEKKVVAKKIKEDYLVDNGDNGDGDEDDEDSEDGEDDEDGDEDDEDGEDNEDGDKGVEGDKENI